MKTTLSKALQLKNRKVSLIISLGEKIQRNNSYTEGNTPTYDSKILLEQYKTEMVNLIALKTAINKANVGITEHMLRITELKSFISMLRNINTSSGTTLGRITGVPVVTIAVITEKEKDELIAACELEIEQFQDKIDYFNATTTIEF